MTPPRSVTRLSLDAAAFYPGAAQLGATTAMDGWQDQGHWQLPAGWNAAADAEGVFQRMFDLADVVARQGACALPGVNIKYDNFMSCMWRAVSRGFVSREHAEFVGDGLRSGFTAGVQRALLKGVRIFKNYESAEVDHKAKVAEATADAPSDDALGF